MIRPHATDAGAYPLRRPPEGGCGTRRAGAIKIQTTCMIRWRHQTAPQKESILTDQSVVVITFTESSKAYEVLSDLRQASAEGRIDVVSALIAEREEDGHLHLAEGSDATIGEGTATGGLIGLIVGLLGGPLGMLLGWGAGSVIGSLSDIDHADKRETVLGDLSARVAPGTTAILAQVSEVTPEVLDNISTKLGGTVARRPVSEVLAELEAAEAAAEAADREARRTIRDKRREERKEAWDKRVADLKEHFKR